MSGLTKVLAIAGNQREIDVGEPEIMTWRDVAEEAFATQAKPPKVTRIPAWLMWSVVRFVRLFNRHRGELLAFFTTMATTDIVAPATCSHSLEENFRKLGAGT